MPAATETNEATVKRNAKAAANSAKAAAESAVDAGERSFQEAVDAAERSLTDAARRAEKVIREGVDALRSQSGPYADRARDYAGTAAQDFEDVQRFVVERGGVEVGAGRGPAVEFHILGFDGGDLSCTAACQFDTRGCSKG